MDNQQSPAANRPLTPAITPSSLPMENLPGLVLPEPLLPHRSTNVLDNSRHGLSRTQSIDERSRWEAEFPNLPGEFCDRHGLENFQFFEERARWLSEFSPDDLINMWDETEAFDAQRTFPRGDGHEAQVRLWSQHQEGPSGTHTTGPSNESRLQQSLTGINRARFGGTSSIQRTAVSAFLSGILIRGGSASNGDGRAGNNSFSVADMARHITWAPLPIIRRDETPVGSSGERDFADDTALVEDSDFDFNDDSGYGPDSEDSEFNYSPFGDSPNGDPESAFEDLEISNFADGEPSVEVSESQFEYGCLANPPAGGYYSDLGSQLCLNFHVGRVEIPEYTSPYGVSVTVREVPEGELSDAEAEVSRDEANTPSAPSPTEVDSEEQRAPMPSDVDHQLREHLERDADIVLTYYDDQNQLHFVDEADGDVEYLPREDSINECSQRPTRNERVPLRSWNGLRRMGSRMPSPVSSSRTSGIRRRFGAVVDKVKKWLQK